MFDHMRFATLCWLLDTALRGMADHYSDDRDLTERIHWVESLQKAMRDRLQNA